MSAFSPQHDQPVTLSQLNQLEPGLLTDGTTLIEAFLSSKLTRSWQEVSRLQNSISHLQRSNAELLDFLRPPTTTDGEEELDDETRSEFEQSIAENEVTV